VEKRTKLEYRIRGPIELNGELLPDLTSMLVMLENMQGSKGYEEFISQFRSLN